MKVSDYSHCIHNWPVTQKISNSFKFCRVGCVRWWHDAWWPLVTIPWCLPTSWRVQQSLLQVTWKFCPSHLPWWWLTSLTSLFGMPIVLAVAVSFHNLVTRAGTIPIRNLQPSTTPQNHFKIAVQLNYSCLATF